MKDISDEQRLVIKTMSNKWKSYIVDDELRGLSIESLLSNLSTNQNRGKEIDEAVELLILDLLQRKDFI